ncbi:MAG: ATP-binding protein [Paludibacteraceae bacterium]|nr:ATP-binding protein [Paludibacteraceae bacterium]
MTKENTEKGYAKYTNCSQLSYSTLRIGSESIIGDVMRVLNTDNNNIRLALEEAIVNIINYAYPDDGPLRVEIAYKDNSTMVTLCDNGEPFNPLEQNDTELSDDLETRKIGGLGIMLIKQLTTSLKYERSLDENRLTLIF